MIFGLFGGAKKQEKALRETLSLHEFEMEFPKMMERFKIPPGLERVRRTATSKVPRATL